MSNEKLCAELHMSEVNSNQNDLLLYASKNIIFK